MIHLSSVVRKIGIVFAAAAFGLCRLSVTESAGAQDVATFYRGKEVRVVVGYPPGGGYDLYARLLSRHIGAHIPGVPSVVLENMPGGGSLIAANYLYNGAPADGTVFGMFEGGMTLAPLFGFKNAHYDSHKFSWLGSMNQETSLCVSWAASGIRSIDDVMSKGLTIGTASSTGTTFAFPTADNNLLGARFKLVSGYSGTGGVMIAIERGEVQGGCAIGLSSLKTVRPQWLEKKEINILLQETTRHDPALPNVPTVRELAKDDDTRRIADIVYGWQIMGRPVAAPPGVPADRVEALRAAFQATMKDPAFTAEAERLRLDVNPLSAAEINQFITGVYETPPALIARAMAVQVGPVAK
jgi:tripartite-type tricarboxylate transporter receptor subunit TctC